MSMFKVRKWIPRNFFYNIGRMYYDVRVGISNIIRWTPVIWHDEDWDGQYLMHIMEWKLRKMSQHFSDYASHVGSEKEAREMLICAEVLKRLLMEDYDGSQLHKGYFKRDFYLKNYDARHRGQLDILLKIFKRSQIAWWD